MHLSLEEEEKFLAKYDLYLWKTVHRFVNQNHLTFSGNNSVRQDLHSECVLVMLEHIRRAPDRKALMAFPVFDMRHAMSAHILRTLPLTYPDGRTTKFKEILGTVVPTVDYDDVAGSAPNEFSNYYESDLETAETKLCYDQFRHALTDEDRDIVDLRLAGVPLKEIASKYNMTPSSMTRRMKRIRKIWVAASAA